jgi:hypothetical protein
MIPCERHLPAWPPGPRVTILSQLLPRKETEGALRLTVGSETAAGLNRPHPDGTQRGRTAPLESPERPRLCHGGRPRRSHAKRCSGKWGRRCPCRWNGWERLLLQTRCFASQKVFGRLRTMRGQPGAGPASAPPEVALTRSPACPDLATHQRRSLFRCASPLSERNCSKSRRPQVRGLCPPSAAGAPSQTSRPGLRSERLCSGRRRSIPAPYTRRMSIYAGAVQMYWRSKVQTGSRHTERR